MNYLRMDGGRLLKALQEPYRPDRLTNIFINFIFLLPYKSKNKILL